jgi:hypothetical protein
MSRSLLLSLFASGLFGLTVLFNPLTATAQNNPPLSEEIRHVLDSKGVEAAKARFAEIFPAKQEQYTLDPEVFAKLGSEYMQAGDMEAGGALLEMMGAITQAMVEEALADQPEIAEKLEEMKAMSETLPTGASTESKADDSADDQEDDDFDFGPGRDDLEQFTGIYDDPENDDELRRLWVRVSCDGHLVVGALWGDVAPWIMRSTGKMSFNYQDAWQQLSLEFNGAKQMTHNLDYLSNPLERVGPLPSKWDSCYEMPTR